MVVLDVILAFFQTIVVDIFLSFFLCTVSWTLFISYKNSVIDQVYVPIHEPCSMYYTISPMLLIMSPIIEIRRIKSTM